MSTLCHSYAFDYQQRVLKTFPGNFLLGSKYGSQLCFNKVMSLMSLQTFLATIVHLKYELFTDFSKLFLVSTQLFYQLLFTQAAAKLI